MKSITSKIVNSLNESIDTDAVENERTVGVTSPVQVHQCEDCAAFYVVPVKVDESICPYCNGVGTPYGDINPVHEDDDIDPSTELTEDEKEELRSEAELIVSETLKVLDHNDYKKFNECYRSRVRMTSKGELEAIVESVTAKRKMTSRQKSAYKLAERFTPVTKSVNKTNESVKMRRQELLIKNESRAIKVAASKFLERQGAKYNYTKFNESMNEFIKSRSVRRMLEDIANDDEIGKSELDQMTPDQIGDQVNSVIKDTGLEVVSNDVDIDGDTATVNVRVNDSDNAEVLTSEIEDVLEDVFDAPVEITGPYISEGDKSLVDLAVVINPDDTLTEDDDEFELEGIDSELNKDDDIMSSESSKNEFIRKRSSRKSLHEKFVKGVGETPLFALLANDSADNEPAFLAHDDSLVSGNEENAEDLARVFVSEESANKYIQDAGISDKFTPVSISIVVNECDDPDSIITEDEEFDTEDGSYFKKEGFYYHKGNDGKVREIDESEFDDAKASSEFDKDTIKESYRKHRARRRK